MCLSNVNKSAREKGGNRDSMCPCNSGNPRVGSQRSLPGGGSSKLEMSDSRNEEKSMWLKSTWPVFKSFLL